MYSLIRALGIRAAVTQQIPLIVAALLVIEGVVEFIGEIGSFILELGLFFVVWYLIDLLVHTVLFKQK